MILFSKEGKFTVQIILGKYIYRYTKEYLNE